MIFVYPADYFDSSIADGFFEEERQLALQFGAQTVCVNFDDIRLNTATFKPAIDNIKQLQQENHIVVYRGWQMLPQRYQNELYPLMQELGTPLTTPQQYETMHDTKNYEPYVRDLMPGSISMSADEAYEDNKFLDALFMLGDEVYVKDSIKSVPNCNYINKDMLTNDIREVLENIKQSRGNDFSGTFVFKKWVDFIEQVRVFVIDGNIAACVAHDGVWSGALPYNIPCDLPSNYYTVDMGLSSDGNWYVVECGDGQVSECEEYDNQVAMYHRLLEME